MTLSDFSISQLQRIYNRLYDRLGDGGCYGWDWPTIRMVHPTIYNTMSAVVKAKDEKIRKLLGINS